MPSLKSVMQGQEKTVKRIIRYSLIQDNIFKDIFQQPLDTMMLLIYHDTVI